MNKITMLRCAGSAALGLASSTGDPAGLILTVAMPAWALRQPARRWGYISAASYYLGASWPIVSAARNFFGPHPAAFDAFALWMVAALLLALPWLLVWSEDRRVLLWRAPVGILLSVVPPVGLIGWASPITAAGLLFPGTSWVGVFALAMGTGWLASSPRFALPAMTIAAIVLNVFAGPAPKIAAWEGIDTHLGGIAHDKIDALAEFEAVEFLQRRALNSTASVLVFPEAVLPTWTTATDAFWDRTFDLLRARGKTVILGAKIVEPSPLSDFAPADLAASIATLTSGQTSLKLPAPPKRDLKPPFSNVLIMRGEHDAIFEQRIPVPIGMWRPLSRGGVPLRLTGDSVLVVGHERAAVLICYEQLLTWPILASMLHRPTAIVAVANDYWVRSTTIPKLQINAVRAWARLISVPYVSATNL
jgi:Carbon-nitrogen hydrolase